MASVPDRPTLRTDNAAVPLLVTVKVVVADWLPTSWLPKFLLEGVSAMPATGVTPLPLSDELTEAWTGSSDWTTRVAALSPAEVGAKSTLMSQLCVGCSTALKQLLVSIPNWFG